MVCQGYGKATREKGCGILAYRMAGPQIRCGRWQVVSASPFPLVAERRYLHCDWINATWQKILHHEGVVHTDVRRCWNEQRAGYYLSKYLAKQDCYLGNPTYRNAVPRGRQWGLLRPSLFPFHQSVVWEEQFSAATESFICRWKDKLGLPWWHRGGFSLLGENAVTCIKEMQQGCLDSGAGVG